jgi:hypothetical protein
MINEILYHKGEGSLEELVDPPPEEPLQANPLASHQEKGVWS